VVPGPRRDDSRVKIIAVALIAALALVVGVGIGAIELRDNGEQASGQDAQTPDPARSADTRPESSEKVADCREDALSERDADDREEALANDGCLGVLDQSRHDP
jgi:hypothetical protein